MDRFDNQGDVTKMCEAYHGEQMTFAELLAKLVAFNWKAPAWHTGGPSDPLERMDWVENNRHQGNRDSLYELRKCMGKGLISRAEYANIEDAIRRKAQERSGAQ